LAESTPGLDLITMLVVHGGYEVVVAEGAVEWEKEKNYKEKKSGGKDDFFVNFAHNFLGAWHDQKIDVFSQVQECRSNK